MINTSGQMFIHPVTREMIHPGGYYEIPAGMDFEASQYEAILDEDPANPPVDSPEQGGNADVGQTDGVNAAEASIKKGNSK